MINKKSRLKTEYGFFMKFGYQWTPLKDEEKLRHSLIRHFTDGFSGFNMDDIVSLKILL